jgi:predicted lipase
MNKYILSLIETVYQPIITDAEKSSLDILFHIVNKETSNSAIISKRDGRVHITFQGTKTPKEILEDLWAYPVEKINQFKFHPGFHFATQSLERDIIDALRTIGHDQIVINGHSLGSAMACIFAIDLIHAGFNIMELNLLACPRFGNSYAVDFLETNVPKVTSYLNGRDFIWYVSPGLAHPSITRIGKGTWWKLFSFDDHFILDTKTSVGYKNALNLQN